MSYGSLNNAKADIPIGLVASFIFLQGQLQKRLPHKSTTDIVDGSSQFLVFEFLLDLREGIRNRVRGRNICRYADGMPARRRDLRDDGLIVLGVSSKQNNRIRFGEFEGN